MKALLRRAKALIRLREADKARRDLDAVQAAQPNDPDARVLRRELAALDAEQAGQEARLWQSAFAKASVS